MELKAKALTKKGFDRNSKNTEAKFLFKSGLEESAFDWKTVAGINQKTGVFPVAARDRYIPLPWQGVQEKKPGFSLMAAFPGKG